MQMNGFRIVCVVYGLLTYYCACLSDCNYVMNVSIYRTDTGSWARTSDAVPIGVCVYGGGAENKVSTMYECAPDGKSVIYKLYSGNSECLGSHVEVLSGDSQIRYSSFNCEGSFPCPYVQYTQVWPTNINSDNPSCDEVNTNYTSTVTVLIDVCINEDLDTNTIYTCSDNTFTGKLYDNKQCLETPTSTHTLQTGCNEIINGGIVVSKITCYSPPDTISNTKFHTTIGTKSTMKPNGCTAYKLFFLLIAGILLAIDNW